MYKEFLSSRVCVIDYLPLLKGAIKDTILICKKYNVPFNTSGKYSSDVQKFFYHYCLDKFCTEYKKCPSGLEKVLVIYPLPKNVPFSEKHLLKILNVLPFPWVKVSSWQTPDLENAAKTALQRKITIKKTIQFADRNALHIFLKGIQKNTIFSKGTVDFSRDFE
jgi:hypothetical protein